MTISLDLTTDWDVIRYCQAENWDAWGVPFTLEDYQRRDYLTYHTDSYDINRDLSKKLPGGYYFVLSDTEVSNDTDKDSLKHVVAGSEILIRPAWTAKDGKLHETLCSAVGSVYTPKRWRKRGYASKMLNLLVAKTKELLPGKYDWTYLYSDVGTFYERFGFHSYPTLQMTLLPTPPLESESVSSYTAITSDTVADYVGSYRDSLKKLVAKSKFGVSLIPNTDLVDWLLVRARATSQMIEKLTDAQLDAMVFGAALSPDNYIIWIPDARVKLVYVEFVLADDQNTARKLFDIARASAPADYKIMIWEEEILDYNNSGKLDAELKQYFSTLTGVETNLPTPSLNALQMLSTKEKPAWIGNGKWCYF